MESDCSHYILWLVRSVDDEPDITLTFKKILEEIGFEKHVDIYNEPLLALQNFKAGQYGLLIIDVGMPVIETDR